MVMILLANCMIEWLPQFRYSGLYSGLMISLTVNLCFEFDSLNQLSWSLRLFTGSLIIALPLLFAALIFAKSFNTVTSPSLAMASNLLGSLVGGVLEYLDMWLGLRQLNFIAILLYSFSTVFLAVRLTSPKRTEDSVRALLPR